ncbi:hypothetical protein N2152v2_009024 [Parachlorella kessleri]
MTKKRKADVYVFDGEEDNQDALIAVGKQLLSPPKGKDALLGLLKEVRLYTAACISNVLHLLAPETRFSDDQLKDIFRLLNSAYGELEDPAGPNFQLCLSILQTVSQVKLSILLLDLEAEDLICDLFRTIFTAVNDDNQGMVEALALDLLASMLEESDDISQPLLDTILANLLPAKQKENPAACRLTQQLLQRTEAVVQPYLQKFLTNALLGLRTDSDLRDECHSLIFQLYQVVPQVLLPVLPHLGPELQVESESNRLAAVDLLGKLFSQPGRSSILQEYAELLQDLLKRLHDQKVDVRLKGVVDRLMDIDDKVRITAAGVFCEVAAAHPALSTPALLEPVLERLRDRKVAVRREVASQILELARAWCIKCQQGASTKSPSKAQVIQLMLVLCNLVTRDPELMAYALGPLFKGGILPTKLSRDTQVEWWALLWQRAGEAGRESISKLLRSKYFLQRAVRELVQLRDAAREQRKAAGGDTSSMAASGAGAGIALHPGVTSMSGLRGDPEKALQAGMAQLAKLLPDVHKAEEGLLKLWEMKDNHIFRGLATLAAYGTTLEKATVTGKDVVQRVGSKGPAAEVARVLVARITPSLLAPELLHAAMDQAADSQEVQDLLVDMAAIMPQLFAQGLGPLSRMLDQDDPLLASCAARVLAKGGRYLAAASQGKEEAAAEWEELVGKTQGVLLEMCSGNSPASAKAAVYALVTLLGTERATVALRTACEAALDAMKRPSTLNDHPKLLTALKVLTTVGRVLPSLFAEHADELTDFVLNQLLAEDLTRGKPLRPETDTAGQEWGRPTAGIAIKAAAVKALAQGFVPDSRKAQLTKDVVETVKVVLERLVGLLNPDEESEAFESIGLVGPVDGGWLRCASATAMLRLARAHDHSFSSDQYVELALSVQDPLPEARRVLVTKLAKTIHHFEASPQRAAKYAAMLGLLAVDPQPGNQAAAFKVLREYVALRRRHLQQAAQVTAAAGGGGANMIHDMPEFMLPYLIFILAHHPDYPAPEEQEGISGEEEEEMSLEPFQNMLQFCLEPLIFPAEAPTSPTEIGQAIPPTIKLLRTLKFCEDTSPGEQQRSEAAWQLCDIGMSLVKALADRATKGKPLEVGRFPGSVVLPRMFFRPKDMRKEEKKPDGSSLPHGFSPVLTEELYSQRFAKMQLLGSSKRRAAARSRAQHGKQQAQQTLESGDEGSAGDEQGSDADPEQARGSKGSQRKAQGAPQQRQAKRPNNAVKRKQHGVGEDAAAAGGQKEGAPPKRKRAAPGGAQGKGKKEAKVESPASRQQPRRGAKSIAETKLRADTSDEEEEEEEQQQQPAASRRPATQQGQQAAIGAAGAPAGRRRAEKQDDGGESDFENASMGSPEAGPGRSKRPPQQQNGKHQQQGQQPQQQRQRQQREDQPLKQQEHKHQPKAQKAPCDLHAPSEDEWSEEEAEEQQQQPPPPTRGAARQAAATLKAGSKPGAAKGAGKGKSGKAAGALIPKSKNVKA